MAKKVTVSDTGRPAPTPSKRYDNLVARVNSITDIKKLKKTIYNRNYNIRKKKLEENPDLINRQVAMKFPPVYDVRLITASAFKRISKIKDKDKIVEELRRVIIDTTRRRATPKTISDYSNLEQDYLENSVISLQNALSNWSVPGAEGELKMMLEGAFKQINMGDIEKIFTKIPSYWAISSGNYYATADFDKFVLELVDLIISKDSQRNKDYFYSTDKRGNIKVTKEYNLLADMLFHNSPDRL